LKDFSKVGESVAGHRHSLNHWRLKFVFDQFDDWVDWFRPDVGTSNAKAGCCPSVAFIVGIVLSLFASFGFIVVLQLFSWCWAFFGDWSCMLWSLEALWVDFVWWQVLVCFCDCSQFGQPFVDSWRDGFQNCDKKWMASDANKWQMITTFEHCKHLRASCLHHATIIAGRDLKIFNTAAALQHMIRSGPSAGAHELQTFTVTFKFIMIVVSWFFHLAKTCMSTT